MYCFFYQDLQVLNYQCLAFCLSGATKRVIRIKEQPHPQLYTAKIQNISSLYFWQIFAQKNCQHLSTKNAVLIQKQMPVLQLENNEILLRVTLRRGGKWGHVLSLVPVMQPLPVRQWNLFAANSKSWEWHENWQNKYAGARPKKDGVILRGQLVTFFHSLYLTTKNALPWSKINYGLELVIPWKQTILYHGTGHTMEATIP